MSITQAVILAAGEGLRLKPFTVNKPKAMISIAGKPLIQYVIESLAENSIRNIILIVGYQKEQIFDYIGDGQKFGVEVRYIQQAKQIGGANALFQAKGATTNEFLVLSGNKLISPGTLAPLLKAARPAMLVKQESNPSKYGVVSVRDGKITGIVLINQSGNAGILGNLQTRRTAAYTDHAARAIGISHYSPRAFNQQAIIISDSDIIYKHGSIKHLCPVLNGNIPSP